VSIDYVPQYPSHKEEIMKKFIYITVAFMLMLIFIGCFAAMASQKGKEKYDLRASVGSAPFGGGGMPKDGHGNPIPLY
jgi:hypothetical protein